MNKPAIYIAGPYGAREHFRTKIAPALGALGFTVTSRWIYNGEADETRPAAYWVSVDLRDIDDAEILLTFPSATEGQGHHVEFGYALCAGHRIVCIGGAPGMFYHHPRVEHYATFEDWIADFAGEYD